MSNFVHVLSKIFGLGRMIGDLSMILRFSWTIFQFVDNDLEFFLFLDINSWWHSGLWTSCHVVNETCSSDITLASSISGEANDPCFYFKSHRFKQFQNYGCLPTSSYKSFRKHDWIRTKLHQVFFALQTNVSESSSFLSSNFTLWCFHLADTIF